MSNDRRPTFYLRIFGDGYGHTDIRGLFSNKAAAENGKSASEYVEPIDLDEECSVYSALSVGLKVLGLPDAAKMSLLKIMNHWHPLSAGFGSVGEPHEHENGCWCRDVMCPGGKDCPGYEPERA